VRALIVDDDEPIRVMLAAIVGSMDSPSHRARRQRGIERLQSGHTMSSFSI